MDYDLYVIGGGSGGVRAARFSAALGARVGLAESRYLGGTCVNVGCVPKKLLSYGSHFSEDFGVAESYGWSIEAPKFDWPTLIANKNREIARLNGAYRGLLDKHGVDIFDGHARLLGPNRIQLGDREVTARNILIATGGWPVIPDFPGRDHATDSNQVFFLAQLPRRVLVVGGGYIAVEFAGIFHGFGAEVTQIYRRELFLRGFDRGVREHLRDEMLGKHVDLRFDTDIERIDKKDDGSLLARLNTGDLIETDCVFFATGRRPMLDDLGIESAGVELDERGFIRVDEHFQTTAPGIHAIGDVIGRVQLTPVALAEGMALARRLFDRERYETVDYDKIPTAVFSHPNIATVGLSEEAAIAQGHSVQIFESRFRPMKLSLGALPEKTFMKLIVDRDSDAVLGCHMVGPDAGEIIQGLAVALKAGATKRMFDQTIGIHPTSAEEFVTLRDPVR